MLVESLLRLALLGASWVMYLLLFLSVLSISVMIERAWYYFRNTEKERALSAVVHGVLARADASEIAAALEGRKTVEADILRRGLAFVPAGATAFTHAMQGEIDSRRKDLARGLNFLGTIGSNSPFVGLLGTVIGVIEAFHNLGAGNDEAAMAGVMSGIAEALIATAVGLFVAIPAVVAYNVFQAKIDGIEESLRGLVQLICADIESGERGIEIERRSAPPKGDPPAKRSKPALAKSEGASTANLDSFEGEAVVLYVD
jgi:biopolymer transport protein ExbB/biopolymer transport protein TolQ